MCPDYEIRIPHFYCLAYREANRKMLLEIDFRDSVIYMDDILTMTWEEEQQKQLKEKDQKSSSPKVKIYVQFHPAQENKK